LISPWGSLSIPGNSQEHRRTTPRYERCAMKVPARVSKDQRRLPKNLPEASESSAKGRR